jgi:hypothetical protein
MDQRDKDLRAELGGIGCEIPPEFQATVAKLMTMGRGLGSIAGRLIVGDEVPPQVRYLCLPFDSEREALRFTCELIERIGYAAFLDLAPLATSRIGNNHMLVFLGVPCVAVMVH